MDIAEVVDQDSLEAYLDGLPDDVQMLTVRRVAFFAAASVAPMGLRGFTAKAQLPKRDLTALPMFGALSIAGVAGTWPTPAIDNAAYTSAYIAASTAYVTAVGAAAGAAYATFTAAGVGVAAGPAYDAARAADAAAYADDAAVFWETLRDVLKVLQDSPNGPLFSVSLDQVTADAWAETRSLLEADTAGQWAFWINFYERVLAGKDIHAAQLAPILNGITKDDWLGDPALVNVLFDGVLAIYEAEERGGQKDAISEAVAKTPNGEFIAADFGSGRLVVVPDTSIKDDLAAYAARKIERAMSIFGNSLDNQYSAITPELDLLRRALEVQPLHPVELFDACASAANRVQMRCNGGSLPEAHTDPLIADFLTQMRNAAADIVAHDTKTQDMITARNAVLGNDALIDAKEDVLEGIAIILPETDGVLKEGLERDAVIATDPEADLEERKNGSYRLVSRVVKIAGLTVVGGAGLGASVFGIADSPAANALFQVALRWLGLL